MPTWFEERMRPHERRLERLLGEVENGNVRLEEPRRITGQISDVEESMDGLIEKRIDWHQSTRDCRVSANRDLQSAWQSRCDELAEDTAVLEKGSETVKELQGEISEDTRQLRERWKHARIVRYTDPPPEPERRLRTLWERVVWAWQKRSLRAFFERYKLIPKKPREHEVRIDRLLAEPEPDNRVLLQSLKEIARSREECQRLFEEIEQIEQTTIPHVADVPRPPEDNQHAL